MAKAKCYNCGLPLVKNEHPKAGLPGWYCSVGTGYGCLPCAERRATGRHDLLRDLKFWLQNCERDKVAITPEEVLRKIAEMDESRRQAFHAGSIEVQDMVKESSGEEGELHATVR